MKSQIVLTEEVDNKERKFGSSKRYYPVIVVTESGTEINALFTEDQIATAIQRGLRNPEDMPDKSFWEKIFG